MEEIKRRFRYSEEDLKRAMEAVQQNEMTLCKASASFNIPKGTLSNKLNKKVPLERKMGPKTYLSEEEEIRIKNWILAKAAVGFPVRPDDIRDSVQNVLKQFTRDTPFINCRPGIKWLNLFLNRHKEIGKRNAEVVSKARALVTKDQIKNWFDGVKNFLINENCVDILDDGRRILNCDETGMNTCPKTGKVLCLKQMPNFYEVANGPEKECTTVLCSFSADGTSFPPMVVYPYKRIPAAIVNNLPNSWVFGRSDSGWMISSTFFEYIANSLYPSLVEKQVPFPVILFLDGHSSHLSLDLSEFCADKQIHLYCLPPNATHILQPCDVSIFKPLKSHWKKVVHKYKQCDSKTINKFNFATIFKEAFDKITIEVIQNGFRACGLYPFDENAVDYNKCIPNRSFNTSDVSSISNNDLKSNVLPRPTIDEFIIAKNVIKFILQDKLLTDNDKIRLIIEECNKAETPGSKQIQSNVDGFLNFDIQNMPMEILSDTFDFNMFDDIVYDNLHCTNNEVLRSENNNCVTINYDEGKADELLINSEENNKFVPINYDEKKTELFNSKKNIETVTINCDEKKTDELLINSEENNKFVPINYDEKKTELFNSKENIETVTINCDEKKTDELLINSEENNKTETMNSENKAGKSENTINADNSNIIENIRTGIKTSNLTESSIDNIWSTHFPWPKTPSSQGSTKSSERKVPYAITSVQWQEIQKEKECVKLKKQEAIDSRKEERKRKAIEKEITLDEKRKKKNTKKDNVEELEDIKKLIPQTQTSTSKVSKTSSYTVGCFVIVEYEEEYFPGEIMKKKANEYQVRVMCMSGLNWKWPEKEDICWYKKEYVMQSIMPPKLVNARKIYAVPEINNYKI